MSYKNLRDYLTVLRNEKELIEIDAEVDPKLELAEIHRRLAAADGPAILFKNIRGKAFPVVTNLFGSVKRVDLAFGTKPKQFIENLSKIPQELLPPSPSKVWGLRKLLWQSLFKLGFKNVRQAPVLQRRLAEADMTKIPAITSWEEDGGPFLTLPLIHTESPHLGSAASNLGIYRVQVFGKEEVGMHFQIGKGAGFHLFEAEALHKPLPAHIYLGGPPALLLSAIAPLPENVPELLLSSMILGEKLTQKRIPESPLPIVAESEFCIVGEIPPHVRRAEGPFGDHYGYYSLIHDYPVLRPKAIYHREGAIYPATVVGKPRQEDFYIGNYLQELLSPLFPLVMPQVKSLWSYGETGFHSLAAAQVQERYERESMSSIFRILGEGQLSLTKFLFVVDKPLVLQDFKSVLTHVLERTDPRRDLYIFSHVSMDSLDYAGGSLNKGGKGAWIGVGDPIRELPKELGLAPELPSFIRGMRVYSPGCLVLEIPSYEEDPHGVERLTQIPFFANWPLLVAVDKLEKALYSDMSFLWTSFTRFDPSRDIHAGSKSIQLNRCILSGPIAIDARMKPWYPKELFCDPETKSLVDRRWKTYFQDPQMLKITSDYF
ncbi:MAG: UbiD family decarboxylase [Oligoflexales bacterium]|nr:UbiD family decarboxylase [Oligoflexales bacterium]